MDNNLIYYKYDDLHITIPNGNIRNNKFSERGNYEVLFRLLIKYLYDNKLIDSHKNIIDLGAWLGDNSIPWGMMINGNVYAIDPSEENINYINDLSNLNSLINVKTINKCISDKDEIVYSNDDFVESEYTSTAVFNTKRGKIKIEAVSLDKLYESKILENIGFIHLDVEGFENKTLKGSQFIIDNDRPIIIWENHLTTDNYEKTILFLKNKNYLTYLINESFPKNRKDCRNFLSIPFESEIVNKISTINDHFRNRFEDNKADRSNDLLINMSKNKLQVVLKVFTLWLKKIF